ncbi:unnamed protein product [Lepeophtheirus salmonis]|uniref:(salmon louse) hypothetical protein n=1 Tax=Lepeophtheirus salmonis TaxID=72036 RepID=A0A7R8CIK2_LEPSM|nr:unnamed protein product [Lepeophtheirus salmonis]CAF2778897.1 unnamed protein product [Lepeophtheirus salmonis]
MDEKSMHNLFLRNMAGLIEETRNPSYCINPNSKRGGMATHAGVALELGITRHASSGVKMMSPQMEAIMIWCQCRVREYKVSGIYILTTLAGAPERSRGWKSFALSSTTSSPMPLTFPSWTKQSPKENYDLAFKTGERYAGIPDFLTAEDMNAMVVQGRVDPKMVFSYVQEVYRMCNEL